MSIYGAMRLFIEGGRRPDAGSPDAGADEGLAPIRPGAWKAWAGARAIEDALVEDARTEARRVSPSLRPTGAGRTPDGDHVRGATSTRTGIEPL